MYLSVLPYRHKWTDLASKQHSQKLQRLPRSMIVASGSLHRTHKST
nr:MAG TPA: hypothetical protein [Caudoviricetes sp.]DAV37770.1 MAG TPA: hypothetical protein [Bacteriophage sp.]